MVVKLGYMPMITRFIPTEALEHAIEAERMGFDSIWVDDHFLPVPPMAQSGFAWTWMSSALQATKRVFFSTAVTTPIMRYNPAIVAQAFATMGAMYPGRVGIGVGVGEELNEVAVLGCEWPAPGERLDMLTEALSIIHNLWTKTELITCIGKYYRLNNAVVLTKPEKRIPVYFSAVGPRASKMAGLFGDHLITLATDPYLVKNVIFRNFEASAREVGKDPKAMERAVDVMYVYDPDHLIDPAAMRVSPNEAKIEVAGEGGLMLWHNAEDIIKRIEELKGIGFNHIILSNFSVDGYRGLKVFDDVLPHVV